MSNSSFTPFQHAINKLLTEEPFYAHFILNAKVLYDAYKVPTAAVAMVQGAPLFTFNTEWLYSKTTNQIKEVIKHEILHLCFHHTNAAINSKDDDRYLSNIATDCAINQYLNNLPKGCVTLEAVSKAVGKKLEAFQTSDYYYSYLKQKKDEIMASGDMNTLDDHDADIPGKDSEAMAKAGANAAIKKAASKAAGNVPNVISQMLNSMAEAELPWKQILRNFIMTNVSRYTRQTKTKVNRRLPLPAPGKKRLRTMTLGVCIDTSGSMSDESVSACLTEIKSIAKNLDKVYVLQADTEVSKVEILGRGDLPSFERTSSGGTAYQPAIDKCLELKCNAIIYMGDFDCADLPKDPRVPFMWVGVGDQNPPGTFGRVLRLSK